MRKYFVKKAGRKGKGLFTTEDIRRGEVLFKIDLSKQKSYTPGEIAKMANNNHADYVGRGRYVISFHPYSYINHSCNPNVVVKHESIAKSTFIALCNIKKREELTCDYGVIAMDQFGKTLWVMDCSCGSKNCRKKISGDFFKQPVEIQRKYYKYLPPAIKRKYKDKFNKLM
jgi:SET domain-containing protein